VVQYLSALCFSSYLYSEGFAHGYCDKVPPGLLKVEKKESGYYNEFPLEKK